MAFTSQLERSKRSGRRKSGAEVVVSQTYKPSTKSEELSIRVATNLLESAGMEIGSKVDVLYDDDASIWMVKKVGSDGYAISGKKGGPTGLIRYTLKPGHHKLTEERADLPVKINGDMSSVAINDNEKYFIFSLSNDKELVA
jgi:hypothetical protein